MHQCIRREYIDIIIHIEKDEERETGTRDGNETKHIFPE